MTKKQLEDMGFYVDGKLVKGNSPFLYHGSTEMEFRVMNLKTMTSAEFITKFHSIVYEDGKKYGEICKMEEIKKSLGIVSQITY